jgi:hypothetical protein
MIGRRTEILTLGALLLPTAAYIRIATFRINIFPTMETPSERAWDSLANFCALAGLFFLFLIPFSLIRDFSSNKRRPWLKP